MSSRFPWIGLLTGLLLAACSTQPSDPGIDLAHLEPLPANRPTGIVPLKVAVAAVISPQGTAESYGELLDYLSQKLGRPVELVQRRTYEEINELVRVGEVDVAFICTGAYVALQDEDMGLLVAPRVAGDTVYYSVLIVPPGSLARSMADLEGSVFAFTDPMSMTGRLYPTSLVYELGSTPERFFSRVFYTYSHDDAIRAVAAGVADGAAVDSLVLDFALEREPELAERIRVIHRSPAYGIPPVVVGPNTRPQLRAQLEETLLEMDEDPAGRRALALIGVEEFVHIDDSAYDSVRALYVQMSPLLAAAP